MVSAREGKKKKGRKETLSVHFSSPTKTRVSVVVMRSVREMKDCRKGEGVGESSIVVGLVGPIVGEVEGVGGGLSVSVGVSTAAGVIGGHSAVHSARGAATEDIAVWGPEEKPVNYILY